MLKRIYTNQTIDKIGQNVMLKGWVQKVRDHGGLLFIDLRDVKGIVQVVINPQINMSVYERAQTIGNEYVISIEGHVVERQLDLINPKLETGNIEVVASNLIILNKSKPIPFSIETDGHEIDENVRFKYRFIDLRRKRLLNSLKFRRDVTLFTRNWFNDHGFLEVETPILTVSSPEGARDYIVPSRVHKGKFYALPQAPQQFKQLLMVGGIDKYFQIAPCFRDEDPRADRHSGAFYQIDVEMSFIEQQDLFDEMEPFFNDLITRLVQTKKILNYPFPQIPYTEAINKYGSDKPDLRFKMEFVDVSEIGHHSEFKVFNQSKFIKGIKAENCANYTRNQIEELTQFTISKGAKGMAWLKIQDEIESPIAKFFTKDQLNEIVQKFDGHKGDLIMFVADELNIVSKALGALRLEMGERLGLRDKNVLAFAWIVDFPFYEWDENNKKLDFAHNPFSWPKGGVESLNTLDPLSITAAQYDLVANGYELASGGIRNHEPETLIKAFEIVGYDRSEVEKRFGHMLRAFEYGAPPHGGFAPGIDRLIMILRDEPNIREIYAFPLNSNAEDVMMGAPSVLDDNQLKEVGITLRPVK